MDLPALLKPAIKQSRFCFIPTVSALGLSNWKDKLTVNLQNEDFFASGTSDFDQYFTPAVNELHTRLNSSASFLYTQLTNPVFWFSPNVSSFCGSNSSPVKNPSLYPLTWSVSSGFSIISPTNTGATIFPPSVAQTGILTCKYNTTTVRKKLVSTCNYNPVITGPDVVCNDGSNFSLSISPGNIYWTVSNPSLFSVSPAIGNSTTVTRTGTVAGSSATLEAHYGSPSGMLVAGKVIVSCATISVPSNNITYKPTVFNLYNTPAAVDFYWTTSDPDKFVLNRVYYNAVEVSMKLPSPTVSQGFLATLYAHSGSVNGPVIASQTIYRDPTPNIYSSGTISYNIGSSFYLSCVSSKDVFYWTVTPNPAAFSISQPYFDTAIITLKQPISGSFTLEARLGSATGALLATATISTTQSGSSLSAAYAYPNPASSDLNIEIKEEAVATETMQEASVSDALTTVDALTATDAQLSKAVDPVFDIRLYNDQGSQVRQTSARIGEQVQFNVSNLPNGNYYLHIYDGINPQPEKRQIVVRH